MSDILTPQEIEHHIQRREIEPGMEVSLTPEAAAKAHSLQASCPQYRDLPLRVYIEGKGCDGFYYGVAFDGPSLNDFTFLSHGMSVIVDPESLRFLSGSCVTWVSDARGEGFLVQNPHHSRFRGKFYKKNAWVEVLTAKNASTSSR